MTKFFIFGHIGPHTRYAVLDGGMVADVVISKPDGIEVERPVNVRWRRQRKESELVVRRSNWQVDTPIAKTEPGRWRRAPTAWTER